MDNIKELIARSADKANKPFTHSVVKISGDDYSFQNNELDMLFHILCRDPKGARLELYDLELEIYNSNKDLVLVLAKLNFPNEPILWCGNKFLWMDSKSGKKCNPPKYSFRLENLATRIKSYFDN